MLLRPGIQTSFNVVIFFVQPWWIINEEEEEEEEEKFDDSVLRQIERISNCDQKTEFF